MVHHVNIILTKHQRFSIVIVRMLTLAWSTAVSLRTASCLAAKMKSGELCCPYGTYTESSTGFVAFGWFIQSNTLSALLCSAHAVKFTHKTVSCNHSVVKLCRSQLSLNMFLNPSQRGTNTREITRKHDHTRKSQSFDTQPNSCWVAKSFPNNFSKISKWGEMLLP